MQTTAGFTITALVFVECFRLIIAKKIDSAGCSLLWYFLPKAKGSCG